MTPGLQGKRFINYTTAATEGHCDGGCCDEGCCDEGHCIGAHEGSRFSIIGAGIKQ